jgi:hypothetical protein
VTLQAFIDDSGRGQDTVFVLAGYIASPNDWAAFSKKWVEAIHESPNINYFKMSEAWNAKGEFANWPRENREKKVISLIKIIERFVRVGVAITIPIAAYKRYSFAVNRPMASEPYFLAVYEMMVSVAENQEIMGISEPVDFIFDHQQGISQHIKNAWDGLKAIAPPLVRDRLGERPKFEDDKHSMPLQAADLFAWWARRINDDFVKNKPQISFSLNESPIQFLHIQIEEHDIEEFFAVIATTQTDRCPITFTYGATQFVKYDHWRHAVERFSLWPGEKAHLLTRL